jgi:AraC-like DNA-binding protein
MFSSIILLVIYNLSFIGFFNKTYEKRLFASNINMIAKTSDYLDSILSNITKEASLLSQDENVINAALVPSLSRSSRNYIIVSRLKGIVSENPYIKSIYLYIPTEQLVFSSTVGICNLEAFHDKAAIDEYYSQSLFTGQFFARKSPAGDNLLNMLTYYKDFPKDNVWRMGQIIINLDTDALYQAIQNHSNVGTDEILVLDSANRVVLGNYPTGEAYSVDGLFEQMKQVEQGYHLGQIHEINYIFFHDTSYDTGWKCVYSVEQNKFLMFAQITFTVFLPAVIIFLLISFFFAGILSKNLYSPVERLVKLVLVGHNKDDLTGEKKIQNEYELIGMTYSNIMERKERLEELVENSIPLVRDELFSMLLHGREIDEKDIEFFSQYLDMKGYLHDKYVVFAMQLSRKTDRQEDDLIERKFNLLQIKNDILSMSGDVEKNICFSLDQSQIIIICRFDKNCTDAVIKKLVYEFATNIKNRNDVQHTFTVTISMGRIYLGLNFIKDSYNEALEALKYSIYMGQNDIISIDNINREEQKDDGDISESYILHIKKVIAAISTGDHDKTSENLYDFFGYVKKNNPQHTHYINYIFMKLIDAIAQFVITSDLQVTSVFGREKAVYQELEKLETFEDMMKYTSNLCHNVVEIVLGINTNKHSKYVIKAQEYVMENYANSSLSLNDVSAYVGINNTYLSTLFKNECGENFVDYINRLRIKKAKELLDNTHITVKEAGYAVGFNTIHNFIRTFKKFEGITPGKYNELINH